MFLLAWRAYGRVPDPQAAAAELVDWIPAWLDGVLSTVYTAGLLYPLVLFVAVLTQWRTRLDAVRDMVLVVVAMALMVSGLVWLVSDSWPRYLIELGRADAISQFPVFRVAMTTAVVLVVAPHLTRPLRRLGWLVILAIATASVGLGLGLPSSAVGAIGIGAAGALVVLIVFGSPQGLPDPAAIQDSLASMGLAVVGTRLAADQSWGVRLFVAESEDHGPVDIKAYGRDATDSQFAARWWRHLWYRDSSGSLSATRLQNVEHEALVTLMAERAGTPVPLVLAVGGGGDDVAILAVDRSGRRLPEVAPSELDDEVLEDIWRSVAVIHEAGIAHGRLTADSVFITPDGPRLGDFSSGLLAAPESAKAVDVVKLLFDLSLLVGVESAVATAARGLGSGRLDEVLPYIQLPALSRTQKRATDKPKQAVAELHEEVGRVTGAEVEEPVQLRRVNPRSLITNGLTLFAVYFLITQLSDIDFVSVWQVIQDANWVWIVVGFVVGQLVYLPDATGMLAAVGRPIPMKPAVVLQSAIRFISLAVPSSAGRIAMTAAFLRKYGVSFTASLVQGSVDTISGLIVEITILVLAFTTGTLTLGLESDETEWGPIILVVALVAVVVVLLVLRVRKLREWVMPVIKEAFGALGGVVKDPKRTIGLLSSNLASRLVLAISMWLILVSMDVSLGLWSVLTATVATGLLGGVVPIPGGVGVSEAVLTAFLVLFGVDETTAFAAAVVYRVATFYIPSAAGYVSMRWLEKNGYV